MQESFHVTGMTCAACQANVTKAVAKLDGVVNVDVSLLGNSMKVEYDEKKVSAQEICAAVDHIGYGASQKEVSSNGSKKNTLKEEWDARQARVEKESTEAKRRLIISVVLMVPLMYVAMAEMFEWPLPEVLSGMENMLVNTLVQLVMATIIMVIQKHFYVDGFKGLIRKAPNMDSLVALGSTASFIYALAMTFIMAYSMGHSDMMTAHHAAHLLYYDSAAMIVTLVSIGKYLESRSKAKTGDALGKLMDLTPKSAIILRDGKEVQVASDEIVVGDIVVIRPGQRIPVDGVVISGTGYVDQSAITGESIPIEKQEGDSVISATMNENGTFQFEAKKVGDDTTLSQIIRLVDEAGTSKAPMARYADKVAGVFVPVVIGISLVTFIGWMIFTQNFQTALNNAISVLVISCPCALGLATPMAIMVGTEKAARYGILLKDAESLENLHRIDTIVLDKTGTITSGTPSVQDVVNYSSLPDSEFLGLAASIEKGSQHPLAEAIVKEAENKNISLSELSDFENKSGRGIQATVNDVVYWGGNKKLMKEEGISISDKVQNDMDDLASQGKTPMLFAKEGEILGIIAVADTIRDTSKQAIAAFQQKNIHVVMLTGDNARTAQAIANEIHVDEVISDVLPADKEANIRRLQEQGRFVAMVGDGINDAPALVRADIGIAIGQGTDIAMDSSNVVLMKNSLLDVNTAIELSQAVVKNVHQNLFWAFFYNVIGIPLAMGLLTPFTGWTMSPMYGSAAMSLSSIFVCTNAWRLRFFQPKEVKVSESHHEVKMTSNINESNDIVHKTMKVDGMMCNHCVAGVHHALVRVQGVQSADVDLESGTAKLIMSSDTSETELKQAIIDAGYTPVSIVDDNQVVTKVVKIEGMMCEHCQNRVQEALMKVNGVNQVSVDLEKNQATIQMNPSVKEDDLNMAIVNAGYTPLSIGEVKNMKKVIKVDGMMCEHCKAHVTQALEEIPGVAHVSVSLEDKSASVEVDESVSDDTLMQAIKEAGYTPSTIE